MDLIDTHSSAHEPIRADDDHGHFAGSPGGREMPDIAERGLTRARGRLDRVGMSEIEVPVLLLGPEGRVRMTPAKADAYVSLDAPDAKGIHMSRLFLGLQDTLEHELLSLDTVKRTLETFLGSHRGLSEQSELRLRFEWMRKRKALVSDHAGWRTYPVELFGTLRGGVFTLGMSVRITYSSTCPCSAALARQLIQEAFDRDFSGRAEVDFDTLRAWLGTPEAIRATPHSQRSHADVTVHVASSGQAPSIDELIDTVEAALQTVVQAAVKREDEQAFALLNGANLMFCEDAARSVKAALEGEHRVVDYRVRVTHHESLHPHDAVAIVTKNIPNGLAP